MAPVSKRGRNLMYGVIVQLAPISIIGMKWTSVGNELRGTLSELNVVIPAIPAAMQKNITDAWVQMRVVILQ